jgi:class 3 adenylate cyclase/tetratricopeptide (TPR) repeat protein
MTEIQQIEQAIATLEEQRSILGDEVVNLALTPLHQKLAELQERSTFPEQQRKQITVLFADIVNSTQIIQPLDVEDASEIFNGALQRLASPIQEHHGRVTRFMGDGFLAVFGIPQAREDDPEQAVRAGLDIQAEARALASEIQVAWNIRDFQVRVGINSGLVAVGGATEADETLAGSAVHLAARIQSAAPPGAVLISADTYRLVQGIFDVDSLTTVVAKGFDQPVPVYRVLSVRPRAFRLNTRGMEGVETHMVGRETELQYLQDALGLVIQTEEVQVVTICGEAGLGKSRLLYEFENWLDRIPESIFYFKGRASSSTQTLAYALLRDLFSFRFQIQDSDPPHIVRVKLVRGIKESSLQGTDLRSDDEPEPSPSLSRPITLEMKALLIGQLLGFDLGDGPTLPGGQPDARQLRDSALMYLSDYFKTVARRYPVVILLEDLHWADDSSLDFFQYLEKTLGKQRLLLVGTARPSFFERRPAWERARPFKRLELRPLSPNDSHALVAEILQKVENLPANLGELIVNTAEGNPFYLEELIKMLIEDGVIRKKGERWQVEAARLSGIKVPPTLTGILQARLDSLASSEREMLQRASVVGRTFWAQAVAQLGIDDPRKISPSTSGHLPDVLVQAHSILAALTAREFIYQKERPAFQDTEEYLFKHALLRDVAYESVLKRHRRLYHAGAARWLEQATQRSHRSEEFAALIADHYDRAGETVSAVIWYQRAAAHAATQFANSEAVYLFKRALELLPTHETARRYEIYKSRELVYGLLGDRQAQAHDQEAMAAIAENLNDDRCRAEVFHRRAILLEATGDYPTALTFAQQAIALAHQVGYVELEIRGRLVYGNVLWRQADYAEAQQQFGWTLALARQGPYPSLEADCLRCIGVVAELRSDYPTARLALEQSLEIYRRIGDRRGISMTLNSLGVLLFHVGEYSSARQYLNESLQFKRESGDRYGEGITLTNLGIISYNLGDLMESRTYFDLCLQICQEIGDREGEASARNGLGDVAAYLGEYPQAREAYEQGLSICQQIGDRQGESDLLASLARLSVHVGEVQAALAYSQQALEIAREVGGQREEGRALLYLGHTFLEMGHLVEAAAAYKQSAELHQEPGLRPLINDALAGLARIELRRGDLALALGYMEEIMRSLEVHGVQGMDEPGLVYLTCYRSFKTAQDSRAQAVLEKGYAMLAGQAARIGDKEAIRSFFENVPANRDLAKTWRENQEDRKSVE